MGGDREVRQLVGIAALQAGGAGNPGQAHHRDGAAWRTRPAAAVRRCSDVSDAIIQIACSGLVDLFAAHAADLRPHHFCIILASGPIATGRCEWDKLTMNAVDPNEKESAVGARGKASRVTAEFSQILFAFS